MFALPIVNAVPGFFVFIMFYTIWCYIEWLPIAFSHLLYNWIFMSLSERFLACRSGGCLIPCLYLPYVQLTHLSLDKMVAILADETFECILLTEDDEIPIQFSLKLIPMVPIDNKPALVQVIAWRRTGDKPLLKAMLTHFTDAYMRHSGEMSFKVFIKPMADHQHCVCWWLITIE